VQRFTLDADPVTGAISSFAIAQAVIFRNAGGQPFSGRAPSPTNVREDLAALVVPVPGPAAWLALVGGVLLVAATGRRRVP